MMKSIHITFLLSVTEFKLIDQILYLIFLF